jgi:hypothetical protein
MKEILHHLLGSCGEHHFSLMTLLFLGVGIKFKDIIYLIIEGVRDVFNWK